MLVVTTLIFIVINSVATFDEKPCKLSWIDYNGDENKFPDSSVGSDGKSIFVVRTQPGSSRSYVLGYASATNGNGYFALNGKSVVRKSYEVLQNPNGCVLSWVSHTHPDAIQFKVNVADGDDKYVGRAQSYDNSLSSGYIDPGSKLLYVSENGTVKTYAQDRNFVLISVSGGLQLRVLNFELDKEFGNPTYEMLGLNEIHNSANTFISQTLVHKKTVTEETKLTTATSWGGSMSAKIELFIPFLCINGGVSVSKVSTQTSVLTTTSSKSVEVTRTVNVPSFTGVNACSMMSKQENFTSTWSAKAEFTCTGFDANEVAAFVKQDPQWASKDFELFGNVASTTISGELEGSFQMATRFFVSDVNSGSGCSALNARLQNQMKGGSMELDGIVEAFDLRELN